MCLRPLLLYMKPLLMLFTPNSVPLSYYFYFLPFFFVFFSFQYLLLHFALFKQIYLHRSRTKPAFQFCTSIFFIEMFRLFFFVFFVHRISLVSLRRFFYTSSLVYFFTSIDETRKKELKHKKKKVYDGSNTC